MTPLPFIPETAPFTPEQRAWLNGFLAGLFAQTTANSATTPLSSVSPAAPGEPLSILFGSQTGTAEGLAKRLAKEAQQRGFTPQVLSLNDYTQANLTAGGKTVIISSTWGDGEPPDNAANFWNWLAADSAPRLDGLHFAVLGLGDKNYADFCGASKKFDLRLAALGAKRLQDRGECDVDYETSAKVWVDGLWTRLTANGGCAPATNGTNGHSHTKDLDTPQYGKANPFPARLLKNERLSAAGSAKEVRHFEISLAGSGLTYAVGDALGVVPENDPALVQALLTAVGASGDEPVPGMTSAVSLRTALQTHYEITKPSPDLLAAIAQAAPASELASLLAPERRDDLKKWLWGRDILDVLTLLPKPWTAIELVPLLRKLTPRLYSISSSPVAHPGEVHLTVGAVRYESRGRSRTGVASTFLADRVGDGQAVKVFVQPSHGFKLPADGNTPIIMVGPGTGIAPFRAFLEEREAAGTKGRNWLFFGDQTRAHDFLYEAQLTAWQQSGFLTRLDLAFSRDQTEKIYVQHRMEEHAAELWAWLEAGAHFYVCGDASRMAKDVDAALHTVIARASGKSDEEAKAYVAALKAKGRYQRDVY